MNPIRSASIVGKILTIPVILCTVASTAHAKDQACWADFYQNTQYSGKQVRIEGPAQLGNLHDVQGENWELRINSLKVGPKAKVTVFENINFKLTLKEMGKYPDLLLSLGLTEKDAMEDSELIFGPNSTIHDLSDFNFRGKIRSLKVDCVK